MTDILWLEDVAKIFKKRHLKSWREQTERLFRSGTIPGKKIGRNWMTRKEWLEGMKPA